MSVGNVKTSWLSKVGQSRLVVTVDGALWTLIALGWALGLIELDALAILLPLALLVVAHLAVSLAFHALDGGKLQDREHLLLAVQPYAALAGSTSFLLPVGLLAGAAAGVWLAFSALLALVCVLRLLRAWRVPLASACLTAALLYLPIGAAWLVLARLGSHPIGFSSSTALLTAVHFHFITLAALVITGLTGRAIQVRHPGWPRTLYRAAAVGMLVTPLLVAGGITLTQLTGFRIPEAAAATLLALSLVSIATLSLRFVVPLTQPLLARALLAVSGASVFLTMTLACAYALGAATRDWTITIPQMIAAHGWVNALGFGLCGLLGWRLRLDRDAQ